MFVTNITKDIPILKYGKLENGEIHCLKTFDGKDRNIGIAEGGRLCLYYDKPFIDEKGRVTGIGYYHCPIDAMADSIEELQSNGMGGNLKDVSTDDLRLYLKRLRDVLNENDLEKYKAFCRQWSALFGTKEPNCEEVWEISWRKLQYNKTDCYPKVRREAKKWLLEHGYSLNMGESKSETTGTKEKV